MNLYIKEIKRYFFKKTEFKDLRSYTDWEGRFLPCVNDILNIDGKGYVILQRTFYGPEDVQLYVEKRF